MSRPLPERDRATPLPIGVEKTEDIGEAENNRADVLALWFYFREQFSLGLYPIRSLITGRSQFSTTFSDEVSMECNLLLIKLFHSLLSRPALSGG